jgi:maltose O-acetyltransferase
MAKLPDTVVANPRAVAAPEWPWGRLDVGEGSLALGRPRLLNRGRIDIGDDVVVDSRMFPTELVTGPDGRIAIGGGTVVGQGVMLFAQRLIELGRRVKIGAHSIVSDSDFADAAKGESCVGARPIRIADEVVLGARVTVKAGAVIGARSQILSGSVVCGEIPPGVVAGGTPARPIRTLVSSVPRAGRSATCSTDS